MSSRSWSRSRCSPTAGGARTRRPSLRSRVSRSLRWTPRRVTPCGSPPGPTSRPPRSGARAQ
eukprot:scaffold72002_cov39-Phaeocystis_antarctica.AAC.1